MEAILHYKKKKIDIEKLFNESLDQNQIFYEKFYQGQKHKKFFDRTMYLRMMEKSAEHILKSVVQYKKPYLLCVDSELTKVSSYFLASLLDIKMTASAQMILGERRQADFEVPHLVLCDGVSDEHVLVSENKTKPLVNYLQLTEETLIQKLSSIGKVSSTGAHKALFETFIPFGNGNRIPEYPSQTILPEHYLLLYAQSGGILDTISGTIMPKLLSVKNSKEQKFCEVAILRTIKKGKERMLDIAMHRVTLPISNAWFRRVHVYKPL